MQKRNPIVVVLGHVDHGKTSLLDAIRKTNIASREVGGITQSIGASVVNNITFIDTPGHAAFSKMRSRGAKVADIAILVVACDDGVAPQTREALQIIREAKVDFVVAGTKSDIAGVSHEKLQGELEKEGILFEGRGGEVPFVSVSAKTGQGITSLLEVISLVAEVAEIKADAEGNLEAVVIEFSKDKAGPVATVVVRNGKLKVGDTIYAENSKGKVRALFGDKGKGVKEVLPGEPARVFGFEGTPPVGAKITKEVQEVKVQEKIFDGVRKLKEDEIAIVLKACSAGAIEAIIASLPPKVIVMASGVGDVSGSDILMAKSDKAYVFAFEAKISNDVVKLAGAEKVKVQRFDIIYELLQAVDEILKKGKTEITGRAQILASFPFNSKNVAGCKMLDGKINKGGYLTLIRDEKEISKAIAISLKKQRQEATSVGAGEEFGVILDPQLDFQKGDVLVSSDIK